MIIFFVVYASWSIPVSGSLFETGVHYQGVVAYSFSQSGVARMEVEPSPTRSLDSLTDYCRYFESAFKRRDQARWLGIYLKGLLNNAVAKKTIESIARDGRLEPTGVSDLAQALQNFINQSPWDENQLWQRFRKYLDARTPASPRILVVEEIRFLKQGRHSVGVQRQSNGDSGQKSNCQIAVDVFFVTPQDAFPLALRLYLPRAWLQDSARLNDANVPLEYRTPLTKAEIALQLLDEARQELSTIDAVVAPGRYGASPEIREWLLRRGLPFLAEVPGHINVVPAWEEPSGAATVQEVQDLRDHPCVPVRLPTMLDVPRPFFLVNGLAGQNNAALIQIPNEPTVADMQSLWQSRDRVRRAVERMQREVGLSDFEGRSWRGFHHHLCLASLAYGFAVTRD